MVIAGATTDGNKADRRIEAAGSIIVDRHFKNQRREIAVPRLGYCRRQQLAGDAEPTPARRDAKRQYLALAAEIAHQNEPGGIAALPGEPAEPAGQRHDPCQRSGLPRVVRKAEAMEDREGLRRALRNRR